MHWPGAPGSRPSFGRYPGLRNARAGPPNIFNSRSLAVHSDSISTTPFSRKAMGTEVLTQHDAGPYAHGAIPDVSHRLRNWNSRNWFPDLVSQLLPIFDEAAVVLLAPLVRWAR